MNEVQPLRRRFAATGLSVCPICLGTGEFGTSLDRDATFAVLDAYAEAGGNFLDTANNYGDWVADAPRSASERVIGEWLRHRGLQDTFVVATKGGHPKLDGKNVGRLSRQEILRDIQISLEMLQLRAIDLYWLHVDDLSRPVEEILGALFEARRNGWIRHLGASNWTVDRLRSANRFADSQRESGFVADQVLWNAAVLQRRPFGSELTGWMNGDRHRYLLERGMVEVPYQSQAFGLFHRLAEGTIEQMNRGFRNFYDPAEAERRVKAMQRIAEHRGLTISQVVLAYLTSQPLPTFPVVGAKSPHQVRDSMAAIGVQLNAHERYSIDGGRIGSELN